MRFAAEVLPSTLVMILGGAFLAMFLAWVAVASIVERRLNLGKPVIPSLPSRPRLVPWEWRSVLVIIATMMLAMNVVAFALWVAEGHRTPRVNGLVQAPPRVDAKVSFSPSEQLLISAFTNLIVLSLGPMILRWTSNATRADLGFVPRRLARDVGIGCVAFLLVTPVVMLANFAAQVVFKVHEHELEKMLRGDPKEGSFLILAIISAVVLAPVCEEFVFRAVLQGWLRRVYLGRLAERAMLEGFQGDLEPTPRLTAHKSWPPMARLMPIVITSALFGIVHFEQMPAPIPIFLLSLALGALYEWTESLVPSIVLHALFNAFNTIALLMMIREKAV